jgi:hypothetical protein
MTTRRSNQSPDHWSAVTTAAYIPQTVSMRAAAEFGATAPTSPRQPYLTNLAWSAETPEFAAPLPIERPRRRFIRPGVLTFVGGGLVAAAAAGLFGALHGTHGTPVDTSSLSSPAPAAPPVNSAPTTVNRTKPATPTHSVIVSRGSSGSTRHQTASQNSTSSSSGQRTDDQQWQSNHGSVSTAPVWNRSDYYWFTHRRNHNDSRWTRDHDSDVRSNGGHGNNSRSSHDQGGDNHSTGSDDNGSK